MSKSTVVLVFGDINGEFAYLFRKLKSVTNKLKNVSMALCAGQFFSNNCDIEWDKVRKGILRSPTQIYILGPTSIEFERFYPDLIKMSDLAENITYLGQSGTFKTAENIKIAFVSGKFTKNSEPTLFEYNNININSIIKESIEIRPDFLLTRCLPKELQKLTEIDFYSKNMEISSMYLFSKLAPQYHIAANEETFLEVPVKRMFKDGSIVGISRFLGLKKLNKTETFGWIKALSIIPNSEIKNKQNIFNILQLQIPEIINFSKNLQKIEKIKHICNNQFCYQCKRNDKNIEKKRYNKSKKIDESKCWFCLSCKDLEKHLLIAIGDNIFLALAKGPIVDNHVLISTIDHLPSTKMIDQSTRNEIILIKNKLKELFYDNLHIPVFYERSYRSSHLQIHCVPIPKDKYKNIVTAYKILSDKYDFDIKEFKDNIISCITELSENEQYFHVDLNNGHELLIAGKLSTPFPLNFGREALTSELVLNLNIKNEWRECKQSKNEEIKLVEIFKEQFRKYDFI